MLSKLIVVFLSPTNPTNSTNPTNPTNGRRGDEPILDFLWHGGVGGDEGEANFRYLAEKERRGV